MSTKIPPGFESIFYVDFFKPLPSAIVYVLEFTVQGVFDDLLKLANKTVKIIVDIDKKTITRIFNIHYCDTAVRD